MLKFRWTSWIIIFVLLFGWKSQSIAVEEANSHLQKAIQLYEDGQYKECLREAYKATRVEPENPEAWFYVGLSYFKTGNYQKAVEAFKWVDHLQPDYEEVHFYLGSSFFKLEKYQQAVKELKLSRELEFADALLYFNLGLAYYRLKEYEPAIGAFQKAARFKSNLRVQSYYMLGLARYKSGKPKKAVKAFKKVCKLGPRSKFGIASQKSIDSILGKKRRPRGPKKWRLNTNLGGAYDDNVDLDPSSEYEVEGKKDYNGSLFISGEYIPVRWAGFGYSFYQNFYSSYTRLNYQQHTGKFFSNFSLGAKMFFYLKYDYKYSLLENKPFQQTHQGSAVLSIRETPNLLSRIDVRWREKHYLNSAYAYLNGKTLGISADQYLYFWKRKGFFSLGYNFRDEKVGVREGSEFNHYYCQNDTTTPVIYVYTDYFHPYSYQAHQVALNLGIPLVFKLSLSVSGRYQVKNYSEEDLWYQPVEETWYKIGEIWYKYEGDSWVKKDDSAGPVPEECRKKRKDKKQIYSLALSRKITKNSSVFFRYEHQINESNFAEDDYRDRNYRKEIYSAGMQLKF